MWSNIVWMKLFQVRYVSKKKSQLSLVVPISTAVYSRGSLINYKQLLNPVKRRVTQVKHCSYLKFFMHDTWHNSGEECLILVNKVWNVKGLNEWWMRSSNLKGREKQERYNTRQGLKSSHMRCRPTIKRQVSLSRSCGPCHPII